MEGEIGLGVDSELAEGAGVGLIDVAGEVGDGVAGVTVGDLVG